MRLQAQGERRVLFQRLKKGELVREEGVCVCVCVCVGVCVGVGEEEAFFLQKGREAVC
jgi:hypothetical protein